MIQKFFQAIVLSLAATSSALAAQSQTDVNAALRGDPEIYAGLFSMAVADQIRRNCDSIDPRMIRALSFARSLERRARALGYTETQIRSFIDSREEKDRMRAEVLRYFDREGVREGQPETYCALGRAEISRNSQAGALLRTR